jgi:hypothetical protein
MVEIFDLGKARAAEFERLMKRKADLEQLVHCCLVTTNSIVGIVDLKRMEFSQVVESYRKEWKRELELINQKLSKN